MSNLQRKTNDCYGIEKYLKKHSIKDSIEKLPSYNADVLFEIFGIDRRKK
jgi:hypothetical protein